MRLPTLLPIVAVALPATAFGSVTAYPAPDGTIASPHYRIEVLQNGATHPAFVHVSAAQKTDTNASMDTSWTSFAFDGRVTVRIRNRSKPFERCRVLPSSRGVVPRVDGGAVEFDLDRPGQFAVEFDESIEHPLLVFADPPETDIPDRNAPGVLWYGPGRHDLGVPGLLVKPGQTVYLAPGAIVRGRIYGLDAPDVRIAGRGILTGQHLPPQPKGEYSVPHMIHLDGASDRARIEGITIVGSPHYNIVARGSDSIVRNVKMIGWWYGTDGVGTGRRGLIEDCFFKVNDDAVKLYFSGTEVRRCVFWQMENGAPFQLSWNMRSDESGFHVHGCDVIRVEHRADANNRGIFTSIHGGSGNLSDYLFEDIRIENADWRLFLLTVLKTSWARSDTFGTISNLTFRNISAGGPFRKRSRISVLAPTGGIRDIAFENLRIGGRLVHNAEEAAIDIDPEIAPGVDFKVTDPQ